MQKIFTLNKLSEKFYAAYPSSQYPEIEYKPSRPYVVIIVYIMGNRFALPFRTNIRHNYCYKFQKTGRNTASVTGIDFSKAVIVNDDEFIGEATDIDNKEYVELMNKYYFIIKKFEKYLQDYIKYRKEGGNSYIAQRYQFTSLRYFDKELGINIESGQEET